VLALLIFEPSEQVGRERTPEMILLDACRKRGFHTLRMQQDITDFVEKTTGKPFTWKLFLKSQLAASKTNGHPSKLLHREAARTMFEFMESSGLTDRLVEQD
jgi:hypothetical protein